jgi:hypothetical protein
VNAAQLLRQARALGIVLTGAGGKLRYEAPAGRLTQELRQALVAHKAAILELLEAEQPARRRIVRCRDCTHYIPSLPIYRASGATWEMPGGCAQSRTSPDARPPIYPCTG